MTRLRLRRIFWTGAAAILVVAALVALAAVVKGDFSDTDGRILGTLAVLLYAGGASFAGLALIDRGTARVLGWAVVAAAPAALALMLWGVWSFVFDGGDSETPSKAAWSAAIGLAACLVATSGLLLTRRPALVRLAAVAGGLAALAAILSVIGVWAEPDDDAFVKVLAATWILGALCYFLVPVLQRFTAAGTAPEEVRVLGALGDVELVAARGPVEGTPVEAPRPGERLVLRRRA